MLTLTQREALPLALDASISSTATPGPRRPHALGSVSHGAPPAQFLCQMGAGGPAHTLGGRDQVFSRRASQVVWVFELLHPRVVPECHPCPACSPADISSVVLETQRLTQLSALRAPAPLMDQHHQRRCRCRDPECPQRLSTRGPSPVSVSAASAPAAPSSWGDPDSFPALLSAGRPARSQPRSCTTGNSSLCPPRSPGGPQSLVV
ncbi:unnamed protein product [Rangifer tarandus platyrhynchus]|uniref:Uncharacterized protein n=2 Tax=Rangifer tarandus platyrhynchus TaxID=3082113 RepID=A0ABN8YW92_RANTA|nr:unnamed protein product [Rangifer tarandus platyrhynchus]